VEALRGLPRPPVERDVAALDQRLDPGAAEIRPRARERDVQPEAGEVRGDDEGSTLGHGGRSRRRYQILDFTCAFALRMTSTMARS